MPSAGVGQRLGWAVVVDANACEFAGFTQRATKGDLESDEERERIWVRACSQAATRSPGNKFRELGVMVRGDARLEPGGLGEIAAFQDLPDLVQPRDDGGLFMRNL